MTDTNNVSSISQSRSWEEMAEFWDTHSLADYEDQTYEVEMTFDPAIRRHSYIHIEPELMEELRQIALMRNISLETLANVWLRQHVDELHVRVAA